MNEQILARPPALLIGTLPSGPPAPPTPESIADARDFNASERARLHNQGVIFADPDGRGSLVAVLRAAVR